MPRPSLVRAFLLLYLVTGLIVLFESIATVRAAYLGQMRPQDQLHAMILGSFEAVAAVLFLIPRFLRWGAAGLLVIFAAAFAIHAGRGGPNWTLLIYAAVVLFVRVQGVDRAYFAHLKP
jgi:uncharacterized membrane protein YphA (DoxX/SURF4 family)